MQGSRINSGDVQRYSVKRKSVKLLISQLNLSHFSNIRGSLCSLFHLTDFFLTRVNQSLLFSTQNVSQRHSSMISVVHVNEWLWCGDNAFPIKTKFEVEARPQHDVRFTQLTFTMSCINDSLNIQSRLISWFSRMSWSDPFGQYSVSKHGTLSITAPKNFTRWSCWMSFIAFNSIINERFRFMGALIFLIATVFPL